MMRMKIVQFLRPTTPLVCRPKSFHPFFGRPISNKPPPPLQMIINQLKENIIQA